MNKSKLIVFSGPSGVGKATIERFLFKDKSLKLKLSCSATTREQRVGEEDGVHYYFISREEFDKKIEANEFIEWNEHFDNKYGTLKSEIKKIIKNNNNPFIEVEPIGAVNIFKKFDKDEIISIFISPPSIKELRERIESRQTETKEQIDTRMQRVEKELEMSKHFKYKVVNDEIITAANKIKEIIVKELS